MNNTRKYVTIKGKENIKINEDVIDFLGDMAEGAVECGLDILSQSETELVEEAAVEVASEMIDETIIEGAVEAGESVAEAAGEGILEGILDGLDDLPGLVIAGVALAGIGLVVGIGFLGKKLLKKK